MIWRIEQEPELVDRRLSWLDKFSTKGELSDKLLPDHGAWQLNVATVVQRSSQVAVPLELRGDTGTRRITVFEFSWCWLPGRIIFFDPYRFV